MSYLLGQNGTGSLPEDWDEVKLASLFEIKHGYAFDGKFFEPDGKFVLMTPGHFHEAGGFRGQGPKTKYYTGEIPDGYLLSKDDLVVAMTEQKAGLLGSSAFVPDSGRFLHNQRLGLIVGLDRSRVCKEFLFYVFNTPHFRDEVSKTSTGSKVKHTSPTKLRAVRVAIPTSTEEQKKIAHILSTVQRAIEAQERIIQTTTELKKALMHKLFTEGLRNEPQKKTEIGPVPESWEVKPLIETVEYIDYGVSKAIPKTPRPNGVKIVSTADIDKQGNLLYWKIRRIEVPEKTATRLTLRDGDVLFNWRNSAELIGKTTIFEEQNERHIVASFILRICAGEKKSHNYFLKHLMNHYREEGVFVKLARRAVNQANYNKNEISALKIPCPPRDQQVEIANAIHGVENKTNKHLEKKAALQDLFRTLLHELMTGTIRVSELELKIRN